MSFKNKDDIKTFSDKMKLTIFITSRHTPSKKKKKVKLKKVSLAEEK